MSRPALRQSSRSPTAISAGRSVMVISPRSRSEYEAGRLLEARQHRRAGVKQDSLGKGAASAMHEHRLADRRIGAAYHADQATAIGQLLEQGRRNFWHGAGNQDHVERKSTRLNSSH